MKIKKEYLILACVIIALAAYLVKEKSGRMHYALPEVQKVKKTGITKLEIEQGGKKIVLNRKDNAWFIAPEGYPADAGKVGKMLDALQDFRLTTLVSESGNYLRYDLGQDKTINVTAWEGASNAISFAVGKSASTYRHTFVKVEGDAKVYQASGNFRNDFDQPKKDLRDKRVLSFAQDTITEIAIDGNDGHTMLSLGSKAQEPADQEAATGVGSEKDDSPAIDTAVNVDAEPVWKDKGGAEVAQSGVEKLFSTLSDLTCERYAEGRRKEDFRNPVLVVTLSGKEPHILSVFDRAGEGDEEAYPAVSSGNDYPFILKGYQVEDIRSAIGEIRGEKKEE